MVTPHCNKGERRDRHRRQDRATNRAAAGGACAAVLIASVCHYAPGFIEWSFHAPALRLCVRLFPIGGAASRPRRRQGSGDLFLRNVRWKISMQGKSGRRHIREERPSGRETKPRRGAARLDGWHLAEHDTPSGRCEWPGPGGCSARRAFMPSRLQGSRRPERIRWVLRAAGGSV